MVEKKRSRIASKPTTPPPGADGWVKEGGKDPEVPSLDAQVSKQLDTQTSEHLNTSTSKAKSSSKDFTRTTVYLTKQLHKRLKLASLEHEMEMSDIAESAITKWLDEHPDV